MSLKRFYTKGKLEAGCDEAGRGCLAGPVVAAAVILPPRVRFSALNDSKQVSLNDRNRLRKEIEKKAVSWGVGIVSPEEIDEINILNASFLAMHRAIDQLSNSPELLLIDGNRFNPYKELDYECIIKGDSKFLSIAAASILAKTHRDEIMEKYHESYPVYSFPTHKGYPTKTHRKAIEEHGPCAIHRKSFQLLPRQLKLGFDCQ
ncbi:ribonuclease HII [Halocola ammonii]